MSRSEQIVAALIGLVGAFGATVIGALIARGGSGSSPPAPSPSPSASIGSPVRVSVFNSETKIGVTRSPVTGLPPPNVCTRPDWQWSEVNAVAAVNDTTVNMTATSDVIVNYDRLNVAVLRRSSPLAGTNLSCGGGEGFDFTAKVDLDANPPTVRYSTHEQSNMPGLRFTLTKGQTATVEILAYTQKSTVSWRGDLHIFVNGRSMTIPIGTHEVTSTVLSCRRPEYDYADGKWIPPC